MPLAPSLRENHVGHVRDLARRPPLGEWVHLKIMCFTSQNSSAPGQCLQAKPPLGLVGSAWLSETHFFFLSSVFLFQGLVNLKDAPHLKLWFSWHTRIIRV